MPFPIKVIQVDGGSEFQDFFEKECQRRGIKLCVLPSSSPKLNGFLEGKNNRIKVIKRVAYGYRNEANFRQRILLMNGRRLYAKAA